MKKFFKNSNLYSGDAVNNPSWTDSEGFYKRVHWLATECHAQSNDDESVEDYLMACEQLHIEIYGAITNAKDRESLEQQRRESKILVLDPKKQHEPLSIKREYVRPYHIALNYLCHRYGLFLRKTLKETLDDWEEEKLEKYDYDEKNKLSVNTKDFVGQLSTIQKPRL
jgi:hypothetical protein